MITTARLRLWLHRSPVGSVVLFVGEARECEVFESAFIEIQGFATLMTYEVSLWLL